MSNHIYAFYDYLLLYFWLTWVDIDCVVSWVKCQLTNVSDVFLFAAAWNVRFEECLKP